MVDIPKFESSQSSLSETLTSSSEGFHTDLWPSNWVIIEGVLSDASDRLIRFKVTLSLSNSMSSWMKSGNDFVLLFLFM